MRPTIALAGILALAAACTKSSPAEPAPSAATAPSTAGAARDWFEVPGGTKLGPALATFAAAAVDAGKKPYAYLHASWCGPCQAIEKTRATDPQMVDAFAGTAILTIDVDAFDRELEGAHLASSAIPVFFKLDRSGKPTGDKIDGSAWGDNVPAKMAPPLKAFFAR